jgi:hypothetical protein
MLAAVFFWWNSHFEKNPITIPKLLRIFVSILLTASSGDALVAIFFEYINSPSKNYPMPISYLTLWFCTNIACSIIGWCRRRYFFDTTNIRPKSVSYQFLCDSQVLYYHRSQHHQTILVAILFWHKITSLKSITYQIPMWLLSLVSSSLAALSNDAGGDTFSMQNPLFEKYHISNSYVTPWFCIIIAGSIIKRCWRRYILDI